MVTRFPQQKSPGLEVVLTGCAALDPHCSCWSSAALLSPAAWPGSNRDPQAVRMSHRPSSSQAPEMKKMFLTVTPSSPSPLPSLSHPLPLLRVISQAVLKWPPAIFPNPSYMLFGDVSSKPHLPSPKQRGCHCAVTGSIDFLWEAGKFCLMAPHLKGLMVFIRSSGASF